MYNMYAKIFTVVLLILILFTFISIGSFLYMKLNNIDELSKKLRSDKTCSMPDKCLDDNICIDTPPYHIRNSEGKCEMDCYDYDRCIKDNKCIKTPDNYKKNSNTYECDEIKKVINTNGKTSLGKWEINLENNILQVKEANTINDDKLAFIGGLNFSVNNGNLIISN